MNYETVASVVLGGAISLVISALFYWRASLQANQIAATLQSRISELENLSGILSRALHSTGHIQLIFDSAGKATGVAHHLTIKDDISVAEVTGSMDARVVSPPSSSS